MIRNRYNRSSDTCCNTYCCCDCYSYWESPCRCPGGITGATGATGATGVAGKNGATGATGATGAEPLIPTKQFRSVERQIQPIKKLVLKHHLNNSQLNLQIFIQQKEQILQVVQIQ